VGLPDAHSLRSWESRQVHTPPTSKLASRGLDGPVEVHTP